MADDDLPGVPTVYWRPGCVFCARLRRQLHKLGVETDEVNIWTDRRGAAAVRAVTGGDETVPTVVLGDEALVNPTASEVVDLLGGPPPGAGSRRGARRWSGRLGHLVGRRGPAEG